MKKNTILGWLLCAAAVLLAPSAVSQTNASPAVTGTVTANYAVRKSDPGTPAVANVYTINLVADTVTFGGTVKELPTLFSPVLGRVTQPGLITYDLGVKIRPANSPAGSTAIPVGRYVGGVPTDELGRYNYDSGTVRLATEAVNAAPAASSQFRGRVIGLPPKNDSKFAKAKKDAIEFKNNTASGVKRIVVTNYDLMQFEAAVIPGGPGRRIPEATVSGSALYDYERSTWHFQGLTIAYTVAGKSAVDKITGNIRWSQGEAQGGVRPGSYTFDVRVDEPVIDDVVDAAVAAAAAPADDDEFFTVNTAVAALTGQVTYKDTMRGDTVVDSTATWDLRSNKLTSAQVVNLTKLFGLVMVVPLNAE